MSKLAIFGGKPVRETPFPSQNTMDENEISAATDVMKNGRLSGYRANFGREFWGGPKVQELEQTFMRNFNVKHAIPCNSASSGLHIACGALGLKKDDEVIVTPYSMTVSATAPMIWGAKPIFADIEHDYYCLDPKSIEEKITDKTKAILVVSLFGQPYDIRINEIAKKHGLFVIEDAAQAIGSHLYGKDTPDRNETLAAGTLGDIGVYSFNYGKHLTSGEGGIIITNNDDLSDKCRLLMNHAEAVINDAYGVTRKYDNQVRMIGFNMRITELQAAILIEQLRKFGKLLKQRKDNVFMLQRDLNQIPSITCSSTRPSCTHSYYVCSFLWDSTKADEIHRDRFIKAVKAELPPRIHRESEDVQIGTGYIKPIYRMPVFDIQQNICPVCESLWKDELFLTLYHAPMSTADDMKDVSDAFYKVWENREELKNLK